MKNDLAVFDEHQIRRVYDEETDTWLFSVVDIVKILTNQSNHKTARKYWNKLKERLKKEGNQLVTNCHQLKKGGSQSVTNCHQLETEGSQLVTKRNQLETEGSHLVTNYHQLKLQAADGKKYLTDVANVETLLITSSRSRGLNSGIVRGIQTRSNTATHFI